MEEGENKQEGEKKKQVRMEGDIMVRERKQREERKNAKKKSQKKREKKS